MESPTTGKVAADARLASSDPNLQRFVFVEPRLAVGEALKLAFEEHMIGTAVTVTSVEDLLGSELLRESDVVVFGISESENQGVERAKTLLRGMPRLRLVTSISADDGSSVEVMKAAGYRGLVRKSASLAELTSVAVAVSRGHLAFPIQGPDQDSEMSPATQARMFAHQLTPRERQVLRMLVGGSSGTEIAEGLGIQSTTVRTHVQNIMMKLQVHTRLQAVMFAVRHGVVGMPESKTG